MSAEILATQKIGLIAGAGQLPLRLAELATKKGLSPTIIALKGLADAQLFAFQAQEFAITELEAIIAHLKADGVSHLVLAGKVHREALGIGPIDATSATLLQRALPEGDDAALRAILALLHEQGLDILPTQALLPQHILPTGYDSEEGGFETIQATIALGQDIHQTLGGFDIGQALIIQDRHVVAIEGAEGTDEMINRSAPFINQNLTCRLFLKASKSGQNKLLDPPVIGNDTILACAKAGINLIAVEADICILADGREDTEALCKAHDIRLVSISSKE